MSYVAMFLSLCIVLIALGICSRFAEAQNATAGSKKISANRKAGVARTDVKRFRARLDSALAESHAEKAFWGILIADRDNGETLYELNADKFVTPASNAKIFTTALALSTLGPDFRFHTTLETTGLLGPDGRLIGDLVLVGHGDPDLSNRKFPYAGKVEREGTAEAPLAELVEAAVAKGLKEVYGDIVADDSYFPYDPYPAGWSVGDLFFTFGAPVSALAFNDNSFSIEVSPASREGEAAYITGRTGSCKRQLCIRSKHWSEQRETRFFRSTPTGTKLYPVARVNSCGPCAHQTRFRNERSGRGGSIGVEADPRIARH